MSTRRPLIGLTIAASLFIAACTGGYGAAASPTPNSSAGGAGVAVGSTTTALGTFLTGPDGRTLYVHAGDSMNTSTCSGACLTAWPPLTVASGQQPIAGPGVTGQLATFTGPDGKTWVTYNGLPIYFWQGDTKAGDTTGQGVNGFTVAKVSGGAAGSGNASAAPSQAATPAPSATPSGGGYY